MVIQYIYVVTCPLPPSAVDKPLLAHNPLGNSGLQALETAIRDSLLTQLFWLDLSGSLTSDANSNAACLTTLIKSLLIHCPKFRILDLSENNLGVPGASALASGISRYYCQLQSHDRSN